MKFQERSEIELGIAKGKHSAINNPIGGPGNFQFAIFAGVCHDVLAKPAKDLFVDTLHPHTAKSQSYLAGAIFKSLPKSQGAKL